MEYLLETDPEMVLGSKNEEENKKQLNLFVTTSRELFSVDGIEKLTDNQITKFLIQKKGHKGKALDALSKTLVFSI